MSRGFWRRLMEWLFGKRLGDDAEKLPVTGYSSENCSAFSATHCRNCAFWQQRLFEEIDANRAREVKLIELFMSRHNTEKPVVLPKNTLIESPTSTTSLPQQDLPSPPINENVPSEIQSFQQNFITLTSEEFEILKDIAKGLCENALAQGLTYDFDIVLTHVIARKERYLT